MSRPEQVASAGMPPGEPRGHRTEAGGVWTRLVILLLLVVAVGVGAATYLGVLPALDSRHGQPNAHPGHQRPSLASPGLRFARPPPAGTVLGSGAGPSQPVSIGRLRRLVGPQLTSPWLGNRVAFAVAPLRAAHLLWRVGPHAVTPASTMKLLTTLTALSVLGPDHRFETTVRQGRTDRQIVLVGGGDPLLTDDRPTPAEAAAAYPEPATLQQLAAKTARRLKGSGLHHVSLAYDDFLFAGPAVNPQWEPGYVRESVVSPISALWVDEGRTTTGSIARVGDPARTAAARFAALLSMRGVKVAGPLRRVHAPVRSATLATVESAPLAHIVQHVLEDSDNEAAEVLLRQVAIATGRPGSSAAGVQVVRRTLRGLGIDLSSAAMYDGSGLSRHDRLPVDALVGVLQTAADPGHPELRSLVTSLPVAGFSGSLVYRFAAAAQAGLGVVRAKTGTLTGVDALAGLVLTRDARVLVFAAVADRVPASSMRGARSQLDRIAAALSSCGC